MPKSWVTRHTDHSWLKDSLLTLLTMAEDQDSTRALLQPVVDCWVRNDLDGAEAGAQRATRSGDESVRVVALIMLADALDVHGDLEGALLNLRIVAGSGHPEAAPLAAYCLGEMLDDCGDLNSAREAYQQAADSGHPIHAVRARCQLAHLLNTDGEYQAADDLLSEVVASAVPLWSGYAAGLLGDYRLARGAREVAYAAYLRAAELDAADPADRATVMLAVLIDLGCGGAHAREEYARLDREGISPDRSAYIRATLARWNGDRHAADQALLVVKPDWVEYYGKAMQAQRYLMRGVKHPPG